MLVWIKRNWKLFAFVLFVLLFLFFVASLFLPFESSICTAENQDKAPKCDNYRIGPFVVKVITVFADRYNGIITAISTALLAIITWRLSSLAHEQSSTDRAQLRAYVFQEAASLYDGGSLNPKPVVNRSDQPGVSFSIKNFGATPAYNVIHWSQIDVLEVFREETLIAPTPPVNAPKIYLAPQASSHKNI
jgi:hypothetical protein